VPVNRRKEASKMKDRTQETLTLDCRLTDEEQRLRGVELVETTCKIKDLEADAKGLKEQIRELTERSEMLATQVRYKQEERPVLCRKVADWAAGTMTYWRQDTGEVAKVRALDGNDKQLELELVDRCEKAAADELAADAGSATLAEAGELSDEEKGRMARFSLEAQELLSFSGFKLNAGIKFADQVADDNSLRRWANTTCAADYVALIAAVPEEIKQQGGM